MKTKFLLGLVLCGLVMSVLAADKKTSAGRRKLTKEQWEDLDIGRGDVEAKIKEMYEKIIKDEEKSQKKKMKAMEFALYASTMQLYSECPYIEKETNYSVNWYKKLMKSLKFLYNYRYMMESAIENKNKKRYYQAKTEYIKALAYFDKVVKNPEKVKKKRRG